MISCTSGPIKYMLRKYKQNCLCSFLDKLLEWQTCEHKFYKH